MHLPSSIHACHMGARLLSVCTAFTNGPGNCAPSGRTHFADCRPLWVLVAALFLLSPRHSLAQNALSSLEIYDSLNTCMLKDTNAEPLVIGGCSLRMLVLLDGPAGSSGQAVSVSSSNPSAASVPSEIAVGAGRSSAVFTVTTTSQTQWAPATITASSGGQSFQVSLTVVPAPRRFTAVELEGFTPVAINNTGQIAGNAVVDNWTNVVLWEGGTFDILGAGRAYSMNDMGHIVGTQTGTGGRYWAKKWGKGFSRILSPWLATGSTHAFDINSWGDVVGQQVPGVDNKGAPVLWRNGIMHDLPLSQDPYLTAYASAIGDGGLIGGYVLTGPYSSRGLVWKDLRSVTELPYSTVPQRINASGVMVGDDGGGVYEGIWRDGAISTVVLHGGEGSHPCLTDINERSEIVGFEDYTDWIYDPVNEDWNLVVNTSYAFYVYDRRGYNLNALTSGIDDVYYTEAHGINNVGQIIAAGVTQPYSQEKEKSYYLLTPDDVSDVDVSVAYAGDAVKDSTDYSIRFTLTVANAAGETARDVRLQCVLPGGVRVASPLPPQTSTFAYGRAFICRLGDLSGGAETTVTIVVKTKRAGPLSVQCAVSSLSFDHATANNRCVAAVPGFSAVAASATVPAGYTEVYPVHTVGSSLHFSQASATQGTVSATQCSEMPVQWRSIQSPEVSAPRGPTVPNTVIGNHYWIITASGLSGFTYDIGLSIAGIPDSIDPGSVVIIKREDESFAWTALNTTLETTDTTAFLTASALTSFSQFAFAYYKEAATGGVSRRAGHVETGIRVSHNQSALRVSVGFEKPQLVRIEVVDLRGRTVAVLHRGVVDAGNRGLVFDTRNMAMAKGLHLLRVHVGSRSTTWKLPVR